MAGDIPLNEQLTIVTDEEAVGAPVAEAVEQDRVLHVYGDRVRIVESGMTDEEIQPAATTEMIAEEETPVQLTEVEALGAGAFRLRVSPEYQEAKSNRPRQGETWDFLDLEMPEEAAAEEAAAAAPTSAYLEGAVAVGIIIVSGPTSALTFSAGERTKVVAEVQNGLSFYAAANPSAALTFVYDIQHVQLNVQPNSNAADKEALWRNPAMGALGYSQSWSSVKTYIEDIRRRFRTRWTYCAFFTKYPVPHFAYARLGGPRLVMQYANNGWGPDNIDRVFAHETGHIFTCPDEYASSGCDCGGSWGRWGKPNLNCENCAPGGGISCIMKSNDWTLCTVTPAHLGWVAPRFFAKHSHKALDVTGASTASGARLIQYGYHGGENQIIRPDQLEDGTYRLVVQRSGKVLDVAGGSTANRAQIIQYDWHGGDNQRFRIEPLGDGYVRVIAQHSGKVLDVTGSSTADRAQIIQYDWHGGNNQRWLITAPITAKHSGKVLDVTGASTGNRANLIQWNYHGGGNQIFRPEQLDDGTYRLVAQHSGKVLDVTGASTASGAQIIQYDWHGGDNQRFYIQSLGDGFVRIVSKHSGKVLDVTGSSMDNGARIIQYDWHGGSNQRWLLPRW